MQKGLKLQVGLVYGEFFVFDEVVHEGLEFQFVGK